MSRNSSSASNARRNAVIFQHSMIEQNVTPTPIPNADSTVYGCFTRTEFSSKNVFAHDFYQNCFIQVLKSSKEVSTELLKEILNSVRIADGKRKELYIRDVIPHNLSIRNSRLDLSGVIKIAGAEVLLMFIEFKLGSGTQEKMDAIRQCISYMISVLAFSRWGLLLESGVEICALVIFPKYVLRIFVRKPKLGERLFGLHWRYEETNDPKTMSKVAHDYVLDYAKDFIRYKRQQTVNIRPNPLLWSVVNYDFEKNCISFHSSKDPHFGFLFNSTYETIEAVRKNASSSVLAHEKYRPLDSGSKLIVKYVAPILVLDAHKARNNVKQLLMIENMEAKRKEAKAAQMEVMKRRGYMSQNLPARTENRDWKEASTAGGSDSPSSRNFDVTGEESAHTLSEEASAGPNSQEIDAEGQEGETDRFQIHHPYVALLILSPHAIIVMKNTGINLRMAIKEGGLRSRWQKSGHLRGNFAVQVGYSVEKLLNLDMFQWDLRLANTTIDEDSFHIIDLDMCLDIVPSEFMIPNVVMEDAKRICLLLQLAIIVFLLFFYFDPAHEADLRSFCFRLPGSVDERAVTCFKRWLETMDLADSLLDFSLQPVKEKYRAVLDKLISPSDFKNTMTPAPKPPVKSYAAAATAPRKSGAAAVATPKEEIGAEAEHPIQLRRSGRVLHATSQGAQGPSIEAPRPRKQTKGRKF